jgi:hypothetical protein
MRIDLYHKQLPYETDEADDAGVKRFVWNRQMGRTSQCGGDWERQKAWDRRGARCERAAVPFFPHLEWHAFKAGDTNGLADLGTFLNVKGIEFDYHHLVVTLGELKEDWAYVLVSAQHHPWYWIAGWKWGWEIKLYAPVRPGQVMGNGFKMSDYFEWPKWRPLNPMPHLIAISRPPCMSDTWRLSTTHSPVQLSLL